LAIFFPAQNLGQRQRSRIIGDFNKVGWPNTRLQLALSSSQHIDAMPACHLRDPRPEGQRLIFFLENPVQLQKNLCRCIFSIFRVAEEASTDPQNVAMVLRVDCA